MDSNIRHSVFRSTDPFFTPSAANRIATNISGPEFNDTTAASLTTYFYAVRAEDSTTGNAGPNGGNETNSTVRLKYTPTGGTTSGTYSDGADSPSFMELGNPWYLSKQSIQRWCLELSQRASRCADLFA